MAHIDEIYEYTFQFYSKIRKKPQKSHYFFKNYYEEKGKKQHSALLIYEWIQQVLAGGKSSIDKHIM